MEDIQVTIFDPLMEIPTSDIARSTKTLSTIRECDSSTISHSHVPNDVQADTKNIRNVESCLTCFPFPQRKANSLHSSNPPLNIDLLLRYYACNSNMEKSINEVLKKADEMHFNYSIDTPVDHVCKDGDRGPLVELRALYKILESLEPSPSKDTLLPTFRVRDVLTKIQSLIGRCNDKQLEQILAHDPSIKMCEHCGVISCSNSRSPTIEQRQSLPRTSYFLNTQIFSNNTNNDNCSRVNREVDKFKKKQTMKPMQKSNNDQFTYRRCRNGKRDCNSGEVKLDHNREDKSRVNVSRKIETMIAERENDNETRKGCIVQNAMDEVKSEKNNKMYDGTKSLTVERQSNISGSQMTKFASRKEKLEITKSDEITSNRGAIHQGRANSNFDTLNAIKNESATNFANFLLSLNVENCKDAIESDTVKSWKKGTKQTGTESQQSFRECSEKVLKNILYAKSKLHLDNSGAHLHTPSKPRQGVINKPSRSPHRSNNVTSLVDAMMCLAQGRLKSLDTKRKEFVSQFDKRACVQSRYSNNKHSFVLHASRDDNPQLDFRSRMYDELKYLDGTSEGKDEKMSFGCSRDYSDLWKFVGFGKDNKESKSGTCLMEEDSLENCNKTSNSRVRLDQSDTTTFSSSSAENMIREWIKSSSNEIDARGEDCERSVTLKPLANGASFKQQSPETEEKCVCCSETSIDQQCDIFTDNNYRLWYTTLLKDQTEKQSMPYIHDDSKLQSSQQLINQKVNIANSRKLENFGTKRFFSKQLFKPLRSIKSTKSIKLEKTAPTIQLPTFSDNNLLNDHSKSITRRITYNESSFRTTMHNSKYGKVSNILSLYQKILEDTKEMDWESFQRFVENLHPSQRHIWRDICQRIDNEVRKVARKGDDIAEVCIEISSIPRKETKNEGRTCNTEIVFEMDMALGDIERFLNRKSASTEKVQLDTLKTTNEVIED